MHQYSKEMEKERKKLGVRSKRQGEELPCEEADASQSPIEDTSPADFHPEGPGEKDRSASFLFASLAFPLA